MIFSYSRLKKYEECPAAFYKKYVLEIPEIPNEAAVTGKAVHKAIEHYFQGSTLESAVSKALSKAELPVNRDEVLRLSSHTVVQTMRPIKGKAIEYHFEQPLDGPGSPILQGNIDCWWEDQYGFSIIDWKTHRNKFSPFKNHQLGLYAWHLRQRTGYDKIYGFLVFLRFPESSCQETVLYGSQQMEEARTWALRLSNEIDKRLAELSLFNLNHQILFPATPGDHCQYCSYATICLKEEKGQGIIGPITSIEEAQTLAAEIIRLDAALDEMKGHLKKWVQANGPVQLGEHEFCLSPSISWNFKPEKLKAFCAALSRAGINPWEFLTIGSAQLKKIGWLDERLAEFGE